MPEKIDQPEVPCKKNCRRSPRAYIQVGVSEFGDRLLRYGDIPTEHGGWVTDLRFRPHSFDLVLLRVPGREKPVAGWWDGYFWQGRLWKHSYKPTAWKRNEHWQ
jgi:hypothetical protein